MQRLSPEEIVFCNILIYFRIAHIPEKRNVFGHEHVCRRLPTLTVYLSVISRQTFCSRVPASGDGGAHEIIVEVVCDVVIPFVPEITPEVEQRKSTHVALLSDVKAPSLIAV